MQEQGVIEVAQDSKTARPSGILAFEEPFGGTPEADLDSVSTITVYKENGMVF
jgi:hypothetical protein